MPLVTRFAKQGNFFKNDTEPPEWTDGDLWADDDASPRALFINNAGTALEVGTIDEGDNTLTNGAANAGG